MTLYAEIRQSYHDPEHVRISTIIWLSTGEDEGILLSKLAKVIETGPEAPVMIEDAKSQIRVALMTLCIEEKPVPAITGVTFG